MVMDFHLKTRKLRIWIHKQFWNLQETEAIRIRGSPFSIWYLGLTKLLQWMKLDTMFTEMESY